MNSASRCDLIPGFLCFLVQAVPYGGAGTSLESLTLLLIKVLTSRVTVCPPGQPLVCVLEWSEEVGSLEGPRTSSPQSSKFSLWG